MKKNIGIFMPSSKRGGVFQLALSTAESLINYSDKFNYKIINFSQESIPFIQKIISFFKLIFGRGSFAADNIDLLIYPTPFTYGFPCKIPYIVFIPNLMHKYYPNFPEFGFKRNIIRDIVYKLYSKNSIFNVVDSQQGSDDIYKFFGIKKEKSRIISFVPAGYIYKYRDMDRKIIEDVLSRYNLPEKFIFYPAQFWHHKNHIRLVRAVYEIKEKYKIKISIVFTGVSRDNYGKTFDLIEKLKIHDQIFHLGYVSEKEIVALYKKSVALVFPSLFGPTDIPCLEAMVLGTPIVCSNLFEIPNQVGDAGLFFNPFKVEEMAERIYEIWTNEGLRRQLIQNGKERAKDLTLENYAKKWEKIIEEALC